MWQRGEASTSFIFRTEHRGALREDCGVEIVYKCSSLNLALLSLQDTKGGSEG